MSRNKFLTSRELEIFELLIKNYDTDISNVIQKLDVKGRSQAILELIKMNELKL